MTSRRISRQFNPYSGHVPAHSHIWSTCYASTAIKHSYNAEDHYYYFRGFEGFDLWSSLYCESAREDVTEFANVLIEKGIVHNYTPKCTDLRKSFLVLRPLKDPYVLNSFVEWPPGTQTDKDTDPYEFVLDLSELMDKICQTDYRENLKLYHKFEMECCQLQTLPFPEDLMQRVAFTLNVYNMAVRHAVICCHERQWTWPTDLESLHALFKKLCYNINGECVTIAALQAILYSNEKFRMPKLVPQPAGFWKLFSLCRGDSSPSTGTSYYYRDSIIATDTRLLFAMTLGIKGSPSVKTIYADRLEEALETVEALGVQVALTDADGKPIIDRKALAFSAPNDVDLEGVVDGCADISVVTVGTFIAFGVDDEPILEEVDAANLRKFAPGSYRREDGKWMKPPGWTAPDIMGTVERQGELK